MLTVVSKAGSSDDGHCHHNKATCTPNVLHEELLDHDVPQALGQDQIHLFSQSLVALLQLQHLYLSHRKEKKVQNFISYMKQGCSNILSNELIASVLN